MGRRDLGKSPLDRTYQYSTAEGINITVPAFSTTIAGRVARDVAKLRGLTLVGEPVYMAFKPKQPRRLKDNETCTEPVDTGTRTLPVFSPCG